MNVIAFEYQRLLECWAELQSVEDQSKQEWAGANRDYFDTNHLTPVKELLQEYLEAVERMSDAVDHVNNAI